ncbi:formylglycine-generating enzyme family protein [Subsaxibacter sp. CAU 1640]|uniref:formylglycine-generating enzyme family protein n=1 Tax=Subsaxibacter sp. CAU 1640 TaxID=2933271 RepID=UPI002004B575|nr:formylglycine-generating enzyme family protein [Subsaxibacter sp. CAU 1640]MCK7591353.1 formylglycine-generating enzyme family protein [Subsaxibacter sp. CAU 1640]
MKNLIPIISIGALLLISSSCKSDKKLPAPEKHAGMKTSTVLIEKPSDITTPEGMVWVAGKTFTQGAKTGDEYAMHREMPAHEVTVDGFFMDITEVTNKQFKSFIDATGYVTVAERPIDWEIMKKELPEGTPKPHDSVLQPGSLIFNKNVKKVATMGNYSQWWTWKVGANWKHPQGPGSDIIDKDNYPVVHITHEDAVAYCQWAHRLLPTEAQWESAAQGIFTDAIYTWGNNPDLLNENANTWQGVFPIKNESKDGFELIAPVKSYLPNSIGIYDMMGNVWELTNDRFNVNYYKELNTSMPIMNPSGASIPYSPNNPYQKEYVMKGGSFLCNASYCASFRISARMGTSVDSASDHSGFRTVVTVGMLNN